MTLRRFALLIAGPRDFAINFLINGFIAWLVFHSWTAVPLDGGPSIFVMVLPMVFIESTLTTFFGYLAGALKRKYGGVTPALDPQTSWLGRAVSAGLVWGTSMLGLATAAKWLLGRFCPGVLLSPWQAIAGIAVLSGVLAYVLHARAVLRAGRIGSLVRAAHVE